MAETHVAGLDITWDGRYVRQRCAWCGTVLVDYDLARVAVHDSDPRPPSTWPVGALVRRDGNMRYVVPDEPSGAGKGSKVPDDCCLRVDPSVTAL